MLFRSDELKNQLKDNLLQEKQTQENKKIEQEMLEKIIEKSEFSELPDKMIDNEIEAIIHELEQDLALRGLKFETWLGNMKKNLDEFKKDLRPQAETRIKSSLIIRSVAEKEKIKVDEKEIEEEIKRLSEKYKDNGGDIKQINSAEYKNHLIGIMVGQKVMQWLKKKIIK